MKKNTKFKKHFALYISMLLLFLMISTPMNASDAGVAETYIGAQSSTENSNLGYLLAGSLLTWAGFFVYAFFLSRKNANLQREITDLQNKLDSSK
ncbi:MAG: hypothetical protein CL777_04500 [Chloroflexi bacterium]|nr:hypothetical protein [Chloroflexota bacterium]|tara:strand:- start:2356 stop:2640 length:285 start_codon:yes stop_codon:yes gene_type:complete